MSLLGTFYYAWDYWQLYHKVTFDGVNRLIIINPDELNIDVRRDIYSAWKEWSQLQNNLKYEPAIRTIGGDPIGGGQFAGDLYFLINGWQIFVPAQLVEFDGAIFHDDPIPPFKISAGGGVISTVSSLVRTVDVSGSGGGNGGTSLTQQQVRDAMTLNATRNADSGSIDQKLNDLEGTNDQISTDITQITNNLENVEQTVQDISTNVQDSKVIIENIDQGVGDVNQNVQNVETKVDTIDTKVTSTITAINDIQLSVSNLTLSLEQVDSLVETLLKYQANRTKVDPDAKTLTIYDDDGITPIRIFSLLDQNGEPSAECIFERVPE